MKKLLNLKYMVVEIFSHKTAKNVGVNIVSQSKDNHQSWRNYFGCNKIPDFQSLSEFPDNSRFSR